VTRSSLGSVTLVELALKKQIAVTAESAGWRQTWPLARAAGDGRRAAVGGWGGVPVLTEAMEADLSGAHLMIPAARAGSA
jgi:hypothetical protein